ncbi:glycosyltransferase family 2 protein [Dysgonomonas termitidis]|uniref:Glycosyltransferase family 2 protein n=1 Tax=Dysgonomonas termitidis TaxID=1516126 RepID=A0ABV9KTL9_9BACT
MNPPLFSILIANYNNGRFLAEALESVYRQSYSNWEVIIVDDHSDDNSFTIYNQLKNDERIKIYYNSENQGAGFTKRKCVEMAAGEICGFLDPDDALTPDAIMDMVSLHSKMPDYSIIHSKLFYCDENLNIKSEYTHGRNVIPFQPMFFNLEGEISHFCTFKKEIYDNTDGIDPYQRRAVDQDLYLKLYDAGRTFYWDKSLYLYRIHENGISTTNNIDKAYYWRWVVNINTAKRRNINIENLFLDSFVSKMDYDSLFKEYWRLKKYKKLNELLHKINSIFKSRKEVE